MLFRKANPPARFGGWAFIDLALLFLAISLVEPAVGLSGLGAVLILGSILVEANKERIWSQYKKNYKYRKSDALPKKWTQPNETVYKANVYVVWPTVFILGLVSIYAALIVCY